MFFSLPEQVNTAIKLLNDSGYEAYCVGGCVRDMVMGKAPHDYDITTAASPDEMKEVFASFRMIETGIKHGTITVIIDSVPLEITTFRIDGNYRDNRHPDSVSFSRSLKDDLSRRDFTVNTLCYNEQDGIIDLFGGIGDINNKLIRCVGDPDTRFNEDALRILRCLRFSAILGFDIDGNTADSIIANRELLKNITAERIRDELLKLICADNVYDVLNRFHEVFEVFFPELKALYGCEQNTPYHIYDVFKHTVKALEGVESDTTLRLTMLLHDIAKPVCKTTDENGIDHFKGHAVVGAGEAEKILKRLKLDKKTINSVSCLISIHSLPVPNTRVETKRFLNAYSPEIARDFIKIRRADLSAKSQPHSQDGRLERFGRMTDEIIEDAECFKLSQLAVNGNDIKALGISNGKKISRILNHLLTLVIEEEIDNDKEKLLTETLKFAKLHD